MPNLQALIFIFSLAISLTGCVESIHRQTTQQNVLEQNSSVDIVEFSQLAPDVWMHTSYKYVEPWGLVLSNGLLVERDSYSILIDTAWNDQQTEQIIEWAKMTLNKPIQASIHTHAHADKMGGIAALHSEGIETYAHSMSNKLALDRQLLSAKNNLEISQVGDQQQWQGLTVLYPGGGHSHDNIVVYDSESQIIFGGCLIRPGKTESLGFTGDADLEYWSQAVQNVDDAFPHANIVIPSHGKPAGREVLLNTIEISKPNL